MVAAQETPLSSEDMTCPVSYELTAQERDALRTFEMRLRQADSALGRQRFETRLQDILKRTNPSQTIIDVSPYFLELSLYYIDMKYLEDAIAKTIGTGNTEWIIFQRKMRSVLYYLKGGDDKEKRRFSTETQNLLRAIERTNKRTSQYFAARNYTEEEGALHKSRAAAQVANMFITVESVRFINNEIARQRREAFRAALGLNLIRIASIGVVVAATIYAGPIITIAGTIARAYATDVVVAANLARVGRTLAGGALGVVGAPAGRLALESHAALTRARTASLNNRTTHACELSKQFEVWKAQGVAPYMHAALMGGSIGLGFTGAVFVLPRLGYNILLSVTTFGVAVAQAYSLGMLSEKLALSLHEYNLAEEAQARGETELAIEHLHRSREYSQQAGERGVESVLLGVLSASIGGSFRNALMEGREAISIIIANSADTLPLAVQVGSELALSVTTQ